MTTPRIALFSSFYNEASHVPQVIESVAKQSLRPLIWLIADDGSTDNTFSLLQGEARKHFWIQIVRLPIKDKKDILTAGRGWRAAVKSILATGEVYNYFGKMDGDIVLPPNYFERLTLFMSKNPMVMVSSGCILVKQAGRWMYERKSSLENLLLSYSARGACFLVKRELFLQIPVDDFPNTAPDDFFNAKAKMLGYEGAQINVPMYELRQTTKLSPAQLGRAMRYFRANPIQIAGLALDLMLSGEKSLDLLRGYLTFKGRTIKDRDVRKFYSLGEVVRRHITTSSKQN